MQPIKGCDRNKVLKVLPSSLPLESDAWSSEGNRFGWHHWVASVSPRALSAPAHRTRLCRLVAAVLEGGCFEGSLGGCRPGLDYPRVRGSAKILRRPPSPERGFATRVHLPPSALGRRAVPHRRQRSCALQMVRAGKWRGSVVLTNETYEQHIILCVYNVNYW